MIGFFKRHRTWLIVAALILLPLLVYRAHARREPRNSWLDRGIIVLTSPLEKLLARATQLVSDRWYLYVDLREARQENIELRRSLLRLDQKIADSETLEEENQRLRRALELRDRNPGLELLAATVVAYGHSPIERTVRIDRGLVHGIRRGMAVIAEEGLIGRVQRTGFHAAEVLLIADERVSLDATIPRSRARGRLRGTGLWPDYRLEMLHVLRTDDIQVGDRVVTSGLGFVFPRGIPIGRVSRVHASPDGQELIVEVEPSIDLSRIEEVLVVKTSLERPGEVVTPELLLPDELRTSSTATAAVSQGGPR